MPSQAIRDHRYDAHRNELTIAFASGCAYVYQLVPAEVAAAFAAAASPGAYHNAHIRDRYPYRRIAAADTAAPDGLRAALSASLDG